MHALKLALNKSMRASDVNKVSTNRGLIDFVVITILGNAFIMAITRKDRSSRPELFLGKGILKICKFTEEHQCRSAISKNRNLKY